MAKVGSRIVGSVTSGLRNASGRHGLRTWKKCSKSQRYWFLQEVVIRGREIFRYSRKSRRYGIYSTMSVLETGRTLAHEILMALMIAGPSYVDAEVSGGFLELHGLAAGIRRGRNSDFIRRDFEGDGREQQRTLRWGNQLHALILA